MDQKYTHAPKLGGSLLEEVVHISPERREFLKDKRIIKLADHQYLSATTEELIEACSTKDNYFRDDEKEMIRDMKKTTMDPNQLFVVVSPLDMGLTAERVSYGEIREKIKELGLELCQQDDGPKIHLNYNGPAKENLKTAMEPVIYKNGYEHRLWMLYTGQGDHPNEFLAQIDGGDTHDVYDPRVKFIARIPSEVKE